MTRDELIADRDRLAAIDKRHREAGEINMPNRRKLLEAIQQLCNLAEADEAQV